MNSTMCTALLTLLSMTLFAGNSVLCRLALLEYKMEPVTYTAVRLISGALMLWLIMAVRHKNVFKSGTWPGALSLFSYMACFSWAYVELPTAVGTLIIAVAVQTTMIGFGFFSGERPSRQQGIGIGIALVGLVFLLLPGLTAPPFFSSLIIFISGAAWGVYCLCGKGVSDPAASTAGNFMKAVPFTLLMMLCLPSQVSFDNPGMWYALAAGALASASGYVIWYMVVVRFTVTVAAVVQLSVPVITAIGGVLFVKFLNLFRKEKMNPMIGAAGISAFPMASRVVHKMGLKEDPQNFLLMHAAGANVAGQIASAIVGGLIISLVL